HQPNEVVFFRLKGRKLHQETISKQFKDAVRKSNLNEKIHFHSLRHSFASLLAQKGVSLYIIKELLGHEDLATTQIYSHLQQQNLRDAVNLLLEKSPSVEYKINLNKWNKLISTISSYWYNKNS
ncbi:MAG: tyrosine-type recombinase/integrase, partial [Bacteroidetes bacterium]|nr:tyrosine-type recombinase/integrase [Bacteroidota bacterium]